MTARTCGVATHGFVTACFNFAFYGLQAVAVQVAGVNHPNQFSLFGYDLRLTVCTFAVAEHLRVWEGESSVAESHALASGNVL